MQQHAGDHMIAGAIHRLLGGVTIGLHVGDEVSTIDVAMPGGATHLSAGDVRRIERDVNEHIQRDVPIRCWFPAPDELRALPLRKPPTVAEHVRVVAIGDDEMVACGGTHPSSAGQLGLVKIVSATPARGKLRVAFLAGGRALDGLLPLFRRRARGGRALFHRRRAAGGERRRRCRTGCAARRPSWAGCAASGCPRRRRDCSRARNRCRAARGSWRRWSTQTRRCCGNWRRS